MEQIIARQNGAAKPATGKAFLLGVAQIILELAIAQLVVNSLIRASGIGLLNLLFYLYAVVLLVRFMTRTVAGSIYMLREDALILQRLMGDSTVLGAEIPLEAIVSIRPVVCGERLHLDYRQVTYVDSTCAPGLRMRAAFGVSLVWARLARMIAGRKAHKPNGYVVVYLEGEKRRACAFRPDEAFAAALESALPEAFGADERLSLPPKETYWAHSLRRAFGNLYPHVPPIVSEEELKAEAEEFARRKERRIAAAAKRRKIPLDEYKAQLAKKERKKAAKKRRAAALLRKATEKLSFLEPVRAKAAALVQELSAQEPQDEPAGDAQSGSGTQAPRRRRGRQE